eukprot:Nk52_evm4s222 gene=Nk52_evmTU4s222
MNLGHFDGRDVDLDVLAKATQSSVWLGACFLKSVNAYIGDYAILSVDAGAESCNDKEKCKALDSKIVAVIRPLEDFYCLVNGNNSGLGRGPCGPSGASACQNTSLERFIWLGSFPRTYLRETARSSVCTSGENICNDVHNFIVFQESGCFMPSKAFIVCQRRVDKMNELPSLGARIEMNVDSVAGAGASSEYRVTKSKELMSLWKLAVESDMGGCCHAIKDIFHHICKLADMPAVGSLRERCSPCGSLLFGRTGCGKTYLMKRLVELMPPELDIHIVWVNGANIFSMYEGETELALSLLFKQCETHRKRFTILIIDDLETLCPVSKVSHASSFLRVKALVGNFFDTHITKPTLVFGIAISKGSIDSLLLGHGRIASLIHLSAPNRVERRCLFKRVLSSFGVAFCILENSMGFVNSIADRCHGYTPSDIVRLCTDVIVLWAKRQCVVLDEAVSFKRTFDVPRNVGEVEALKILFEKMALCMRPVGISEYTATRSQYCFSESILSGIDDIIETLRRMVIYPLLSLKEKVDRTNSTRLESKCTKGVLLYGAPGAGKSKIASCIVSELGFKAVSVDASEFRCKVVGESEMRLRALFRRAQNSGPVVIIIDNIDVLVPRRKHEGGGSGVASRLLSCFLSEIDGVLSKSKFETLIIGTTNSPCAIDPAVLRPGRIELHLRVPAPDIHARLAILKSYFKQIPCDSSVTDLFLATLAEQMEFYSGADIENIFRESVLCALGVEWEAETISKDNIMKAFRQSRPSLINWKEEIINSV